MQFSGEIHVPAARENVFDRLRDPQFFASCVEGVGGLTDNGANQYSARLTTKIAYIRIEFDVSVQIVRAERPELIEARIDGKPHGVVGRLTATSSANFAEDGNGTKVRYEIEANLTGRLGSIGQPVLKSKAKEMERQFAENLRRAFPGTEGDAAA
jgi:carbon monoxide dehydrogenase subunit G